MFDEACRVKAVLGALGTKIETYQESWANHGRTVVEKGGTLLSVTVPGGDASEFLTRVREIQATGAEPTKGDEQ